MVEQFFFAIFLGAFIALVVLIFQYVIGWEEDV